MPTTASPGSATPVTAPAATYVLVIGVMATFISFGIVFSFTAPWYWFLIPVALAIPEIVILSGRWRARQRMRRDLQQAVQDLS
ncbi:MAG TPA: hypothetical protein VFM01_12825 [Nakamurella sp.]|nr:hypothetical protein [Nakamurella sp.]